MSSYFKNNIYNTIKSAVQHSSGIDNDVLSVIIEYLLSHHVNICNIFDEEFIKIMLVEASNASEDWQNLLVDIVEKNDDLKNMYKPRIRIYHDSELLNLFNMKMHQKTFGDEKVVKWLRTSLEYNHFKIFETNIND